MSFPPGSGAGLSGLAPDVLKSAGRALGRPFWDELARVAALFANGLVPGDVRPFFFGARLVALLKKDGGIRLIACGEAIRRLAGRLLSFSLRDRLRALFPGVQQVGVALPCGAEGLVRAARILSARWVEDNVEVHCQD